MDFFGDNRLLDSMRCALPKMSVSLIYLGGSRTENVGGGQSLVGGVILGVGQRETKSGHSEDKG